MIVSVLLYFFLKGRYLASWILCLCFIKLLFIEQEQTVHRRKNIREPCRGELRVGFSGRTIQCDCQRATVGWTAATKTKSCSLDFLCRVWVVFSQNLYSRIDVFSPKRTLVSIFDTLSLHYAQIIMYRTRSNCP